MTETTPAAKLLAIDDAMAVIEAHLTPLATEPVALEHAYGRFVAEDVYASLALPPFDNSAMDGYALRAADTPGRLTVVGESAAGVPFTGTVARNQATAVSTGAALPDGADVVVPVEDVVLRDGVVEIEGAIPTRQFVRDRGSDLPAGALLLRVGSRIGPAQIGAAAAAGIDRLACRRRPRVAILTTGTELRQPGDELRHGEIYDANGPMLRAALHAGGAHVTTIPAATDSVDAHTVALERALEHDVVISSGGVSVGAHDLVREVARELGVRELFWQIALRPGKPLTFGVRENTLMFGLPGNPVSTLVCFQLFVAPALLALQGARVFRPAFRRGRLNTAVARNPRRDDLIRVRLVPDTAGEDGAPVLEPLPGQQSHQIAVAAQADGLARIPTGSGTLAAGAAVSFLAIDTFAADRG